MPQHPVLLDPPPDRMAVEFSFDGGGAVAIFNPFFSNDENRALHAAFQREIRRRKLAKLPTTGRVQSTNFEENTHG